MNKNKLKQNVTHVLVGVLSILINFFLSLCCIKRPLSDNQQAEQEQ